MSDRIEEQRYQNAILARELAKKKTLETQRAKAFAERLSLIRVIKEKPIEKTKAVEEKRPEANPEDQRPETPKRQSAAPRPSTAPKRSREKESDSFLQMSAQLAAKEKAQPDTPQIAEPALHPHFVAELVDRIQTHANLQGSKFVTISFKANVLAGARVVVSVSQGKVRLRFEDTDPQGKILLRNSKHLLQSRLAEKKLSLQDFEVH